MDKGQEFISLELTEWAESRDVGLEFIQPGKPTQNVFIKRLNRTYLTEILDYYLFSTLNEVREITDKWAGEHNTERPRESLYNLMLEQYRKMDNCGGTSKDAWN